MHLLAFRRFNEIDLFIDQSIKFFENRQPRLNADVLVKRTNMLMIVKKQVWTLHLAEKSTPRLIKLINFWARLRYPAKSAKSKTRNS